jgi:NACalpha-BTF3-like transcription factor
MIGMPKNYSIEDVETLRSKAGVSYEEAVSLLDKYDGDLARALIELEKRGQVNGKADLKFDAEEIVEWVKKMWHKGMNTRVVIERKGETLVNLPVIFLILMLMLGVHAMIVAAVIMLVTGCSVSLRGENKKAQTIIKGDEAENVDIEPSISDDEPEKTDDDDFPSITIS